jgi:hypothetical protein
MDMQRVVKWTLRCIIILLGIYCTLKYGFVFPTTDWLMWVVGLMSLFATILLGALFMICLMWIFND